MINERKITILTRAGPLSLRHWYATVVSSRYTSTVIDGNVCPFKLPSHPLSEVLYWYQYLPGRYEHNIPLVNLANPGYLPLPVLNCDYFQYSSRLITDLLAFFQANVEHERIPDIASGVGTRVQHGLNLEFSVG